MIIFNQFGMFVLQLKIASNTFFQNNVEVDKWVRHRLFAKLRKLVDKEKWV